MQANGNQTDAGPAQPTTSPPDPLAARLQRRLQEACYDLWDSFVDPREAFWDTDGGWLPLGTSGTSGPYARPAIVNEQQLRELRAECRLLAATNEFAINGHENRISYLVGAGHTYRAAIRKGSTAEAPLASQVQVVLDTFVRENKWQRRQQEIVRRLDRDGEAFLRLFVDRAGCTRVRFIEPDQVATPTDRAGDPGAGFGVLTDSEDVESVLAYFVDGQPVDAGQIQHRKANVDGNVKRGLPLFFPVRKNLRRAEKLLRNMSVVAEIQSAIALIRKHQGGTRSGVQQFAASQADATLTQAATGRTTSFRRFGPGTILDAPGGIEYDFPAAGLDAANFVAVLQAELRAIASRLVMPEFMLTSDASNSNYASTMVAEGPAMRMFTRLQADLVTDDLEVMWHVVRAAVAAGGLPTTALSEIEIQVSPPSLAVRDQKEEAEVHQIEYQNGILSPQTWSRRRGLDYDQEQANLAQHNERVQEVPGAELSAPVVGIPLGESHRVDVSDLVREITEGGWDPARHPRGGNPQNRGEFSTTGGDGRSGASASGQPAIAQAHVVSPASSSRAPIVRTATKTSAHAELTARKSKANPVRRDSGKPETHTVDRSITAEERKAAWQRAAIASAVYGGKDAHALPPGWKEVRKYDRVSDKKSPKGFRAAVYKDSNGNYILAFAGTNDLKDLLDNSRQAAGVRSRQYDRAVALAQEWQEKAKEEGKAIEFVGHSLGGGLATVAAVVTGGNATVFNPPGVHQNTIERYLNKDKANAALENAKNNITAFRYQGEFLGLQDKLVAGALLPNLVGKRITTDSRQHPYRPVFSNIGGRRVEGSIDRHKIDKLIRALDPAQALETKVKK